MGNITTPSLKHFIESKKKKKIPQRPFRVEISNVTTKTFVSSIEIKSTVSTGGSLSFYWNVLEDLPLPLYAKAKVMLKSSSGYYDLEMINRTIEVCKFFNDRKYEPILQVFFKLFIKTSKFPSSCPIRKVNLYNVFRKFQKEINSLLFS